MLSELEKQAKMGRQAMNIQIMEQMFQSVDSDGRPIDEPGYMKMALYNLETISAEEVEEIMKAGTYDQDPPYHYGMAGRNRKCISSQG